MPILLSEQPNIQAVALHYFSVDYINQDFARQIGLKQDKRANWYLMQYNTSGRGFEEKYLNAIRMFGQPTRVVRL